MKMNQISIDAFCWNRLLLILSMVLSDFVPLFELDYQTAKRSWTSLCIQHEHQIHTKFPLVWDRCNKSRPYKFLPPFSIDTHFGTVLDDTYTIAFLNRDNISHSSCISFWTPFAYLSRNLFHFFGDFVQSLETLALFLIQMVHFLYLWKLIWIRFEFSRILLFEEEFSELFWFIWTGLLGGGWNPVGR